LSEPPAERFSPVGSPVADQVYPPVPPLAVNVTGPYATPTVAAESEVGAVILSVGGVMISGSETDAVALLESLTVNPGL